MYNTSILGNPDFIIMGGDIPEGSLIELTPLKVNLILPDESRLKLSDMIQDIRLVDSTNYDIEQNKLANSDTLGCLGSSGCLYALLGPIGCLFAPVHFLANSVSGKNQPKSHVIYEIELNDNRYLQVSSIYPIYLAIINITKART